MLNRNRRRSSSTGKPEILLILDHLSLAANEAALLALSNPVLQRSPFRSHQPPNISQSLRPEPSIARPCRKDRMNARADQPGIARISSVSNTRRGYCYIVADHQRVAGNVGAARSYRATEFAAAVQVGACLRAVCKTATVHPGSSRTRPGGEVGGGLQGVGVLGAETRSQTAAGQRAGARLGRAATHDSPARCPNLDELPAKNLRLLAFIRSRPGRHRRKRRPLLWPRHGSRGRSHAGRRSR